MYILSKGARTRYPKYLMKLVKLWPFFIEIVWKTYIFGRKRVIEPLHPFVIPF